MGMARIKEKPASKNSTYPSNSGGGRVEYCLNPWNGECRSTEIAVYIMYGGERIPLCWKCWREISRKNIVWEA